MSGELSGGVIPDPTWYEVNGLKAPAVVNYEAPAEAASVTPQSERAENGCHSTEPCWFDYDSGVVQLGENPYDFDR